MAEITHGTAFAFGVDGTVVDAAVQSFNPKYSHQNKTQVMNEGGNQVSDRSDDLITEASITLKHESTYTSEAPGNIITYDTVKYWVVDVDNNQTNSDHQEITYNVKNTEYITLV